MDYIQTILDKWAESGISMGEMAQKTYLSESTLRRLKNGQNATYDTLLRVADALGVGGEDLRPASIDDQYELRLAEMRLAHAKEVDLYERVVKAYKRRELLKTVAIVLLALAVAFYFFKVDLPNNNVGIVTYEQSVD